MNGGVLYLVILDKRTRVSTSANDTNIFLGRECKGIFVFISPNALTLKTVEREG